MAESVDALVSNTSGAIRAGSTPALGTIFIPQSSDIQQVGGFSCNFASTLHQHFGFFSKNAIFATLFPLPFLMQF